MIAPLTLAQVADYIGSSLNAVLKNGNATFTQVNTDTRTLAAGELFVALRGERFDAHDFLQEAADKNVCGCVVEQFNPAVTLPQLVVSNTLLALGQIAAMNRNVFSKPVLAITGSSGKTSVKTMLADILSECGKVHATKGNLNNHIGVPLTLLQLAADNDFAVIEMGASAIGEIDYLCSLARPQITMINNVMPAHIAGFGSLDGVAQAKGEIYSRLTGSDTAVVNIDDVYAPQWLEKITSNIIRVSLKNASADCFAENIQAEEDTMCFILVLRNERIAIKINTLGEHSVKNALMAAAMAHAAGASLLSIQQGLAKFAPVSGRMSRHKGLNDSLVIDDSYNANPGSVRAAIDVLVNINGQRILVLGDLAELGSDAEQQHASLGEYAQQKKIDLLFTLGNLSQYAAETFNSRVNDSKAIAQHFSTREALIEKLASIASSNTTILIKGSRSSKMDLIVKALCSLGESH